MGQDNPVYLNVKTLAVLLGCSHRLVKHLVRTGRISAVRGYTLEEQGVEPSSLRCGGYYWRNSWWVTVEDFVSYLENIYKPPLDVMDSILASLGELLE